jgi:hypothetical protein
MIHHRRAWPAVLRCGAPIAALLFLAASLAPAAEPEISIRVSVKRVIDAVGNAPGGRWGSPVEIARTIDRCNEALERSGSHWRLDLVEVEDTAGPAAAFAEMSGARMAEMEASAKADPQAFRWRADAVNIYVVDRVADAGGICSFPAAGSHRDLIVINSQGLLGGSEGWLHEIGHYFNLIHTRCRSRAASSSCAATAAAMAASTSRMPASRSSTSSRASRRRSARAPATPTPMAAST